LAGPAAVSTATDPGRATALISDAGLGSASGSDDSGSVTLVRSGVPAGNLFAVGSTTVTYTATDTAGNSTVVMQLVTVADRENPVLTVPGPITVWNDTGSNSAVVNFAATATDNVPGAT